MIHEWIRKDLEGNSSCLIWRTNPKFVGRDWGKLEIPSKITASLRAEFWIRYLPKTRQEWHPLYCDVVEDNIRQYSDKEDTKISSEVNYVRPGFIGGSGNYEFSRKSMHINLVHLLVYLPGCTLLICEIQSKHMHFSWVMLCTEKSEKDIN
jgi:hypothetical protein